MVNIGAAYNLNVGAMMATVVGVNQIAKIGSEKTTTVGKKYELTVGGGGAPAGGGLTMNIQAPSAGGGGGSKSNITMDDETITLQVGKSVMVMKADGSITMNGKEIDLVADVDAPQIEQFDKPFETEAANVMLYQPVGVGPVGKWWTPRRQKAGTYNQAWKENRWPRLPLDFDFGYWNAAPEDQQIEYPHGGEEVIIAGMTQGGRPIRCTLPEPELHAVLRMEIGPIVALPMRLDTLVFDLKAMTLSCVYRIHIGAQFGARVLELRPGRTPA